VPLSSTSYAADIAGFDHIAALPVFSFVVHLSLPGFENTICFKTYCSCLPNAVRASPNWVNLVVSLQRQSLLFFDSGEV
jgi:hypothetical protein